MNVARPRQHGCPLPECAGRESGIFCDLRERERVAVVRESLTRAVDLALSHAQPAKQPDGLTHSLAVLLLKESAFQARPENFLWLHGISSKDGGWRIFSSRSLQTCSQ